MPKKATTRAYKALANLYKTKEELDKKEDV
jgi:hypothetical protein